jgi:hypothetical protein
VCVSSATTSTANDVETSLIFVDYSSEPISITSKNMVRTDTAVMIPVSSSTVIVGSGNKPKSNQDQFVLLLSKVSTDGSTDTVSTLDEFKYDDGDYHTVTATW